MHAHKNTGRPFTRFAFVWLTFSFSLGVKAHTSLTSANHASHLFSASEIIYFQQKKVVHYCIDPDWKPVEWMDKQQQHRGFVAQIIQLINHRLPLTFELVPTSSWLESIQKIKDQSCDILVAAMKTENRSTYLNFTQPYYSLANVIVTHIDTPTIQGINDEPSRIFAVVRGYAISELLAKNYPDIQLVYVDSILEGLQKVSAKKVDGYIDHELVLNHAIQENALLSLKINNTWEEHFSLSIGVRQDHPELLSILDKALDSIPESEKRTLYQQWMEGIPSMTPTTPFPWKYGVSIFLLCVLALGSAGYVVRTRQLQSELNQKTEDFTHKMAMIRRQDPITDLLNSHAIFLELQTLLMECRDSQKESSIILFEIKQFRDNCYHIIPSHRELFLKECATLIAEQLDEKSLLGRWSDNRFLILQPHIESFHSVVLAELIRNVFDSHQFVFDLQLTATFVIEILDHRESADQLLQRMEAKLNSHDNSSVQVIHPAEV
ncbi:transporter substrate-binding domain-containing protein [Algicola sagamiensis]|uniref:transporter substrate-binding domain-containing protein n=1 Tax=Algicola sagamiensis TaxID=163869 RepID=UPI000379B89B|nr:transporter substrate-binding domain-containing protein [Algicola sagamiensis]